MSEKIQGILWGFGIFWSIELVLLAVMQQFDLISRTGAQAVGGFLAGDVVLLAMAVMVAGLAVLFVALMSAGIWRGIKRLYTRRATAK